MWGVDDPTAPHAPATNLPDAQLNVLHVTIWYVIQLSYEQNTLYGSILYSGNSPTNNIYFPKKHTASVTNSTPIKN